MKTQRGILGTKSTHFNPLFVTVTLKEVCLKTVDFPQDELFGSQKSKFFQIFFASTIDCTTTMAAQGVDGWNFEEIQFLIEQ